MWFSRHPRGNRTQGARDLCQHLCLLCTCWPKCVPYLGSSLASSLVQLCSQVALNSSAYCVFFFISCLHFGLYFVFFFILLLFVVCLYFFCMIVCAIVCVSVCIFVFLFVLCERACMCFLYQNISSHNLFSSFPSRQGHRIPAANKEYMLSLLARLLEHCGHLSLLDPLDPSEMGTVPYRRVGYMLHSSPMWEQDR